MLQGTAKYLFSPLSLSVIGALLASLALSFTMVPVLFNYLMRGSVQEFEEEGTAIARTVQSGFEATFWCVFKQASNAASNRLRESYRETLLAWALSQARLTVIAFIGLIVGFSRSVPIFSAEISFRKSMPDRCACTCSAPAGTRLEKNAAIFFRCRGADQDAGGQRSNRRDAR